MIIIGIDPHKSVHEACALTGASPEQLRFPASGAGYQWLLKWGEAIPERVWAIEGAQGLGRHLAQFLLARGESVVDVPSFLSAHSRAQSRRAPQE
jgi:transposase